MTSFATQTNIDMGGPGLLGSDVSGASRRKSKLITIGAGLTLSGGVLVNTLDLSGYVPYTGATTNLNLGAYAITCGAITASGNLSVSGVIIAPLGMIASANNAAGVQVSATSLIPATGNGFGYNDNAADLGIAVSRWRDLYIGRNAVIGGTITARGQLSANASGLTATFGPISGTAVQYAYIGNGTGKLWFGVESSAGGGLFTGGSAYAAVVGTSSTTSFQIATNNTVRTTWDSSGNATFTGDITLSTGVISLSSDRRIICGAAGSPLRFIYTNAADAAISCAAITASGTIAASTGVTLPVTQKVTFTDAAGSPMSLQAIGYGSIRFASQYTGYGELRPGGNLSPSYVGSPSINIGTISNTGYISFGFGIDAGYSGGVFTLRPAAAGIARFRNVLDTDFASIECGAITASGNISTSGSINGTSILCNGSTVFYTSGYRLDCGVAGGFNTLTVPVLLQLGGTTSSYPAIKRSGTTTAFRLADDSADGPITCGAITASGLITASVGLESNTYVISNTGRFFSRNNSSQGYILGASDDCNMNRIGAGIIGFGTGATGSTAAEIRCGAVTASGLVTVDSLCSSSLVHPSRYVYLNLSAMYPGSNNMGLGTSGNPWGASYFGAITASGNISGVAGSFITLGVTSGTSTFNQVQIAAGNSYFWNGRSQIASPSDGVVAFKNNAGSADAALTCGAITASGAIQETPTQSASDPTITDIPTGKRMGWYNSTSGEFRDWVNIGGTLKKSAAYT